MAQPNEKLAKSLTALRALQADGRRVFRSKELTRTHRERLMRNGFVREIVRGWMMSLNPSASLGDSTLWHASFWEFCGAYFNERFDEAWHLSPEQSLLLHAENSVIPAHFVVYSPKGSNHETSLLFGTSVYDLKQSVKLSPTDLSTKADLRLLSPASSLVRVSEPFFARNPIETTVVLSGIRDATDILRLLLNGGHTAKAGLLAGAFRRIGGTDIADEIVAAMRAADHDVRESDPFVEGHLFGVLKPKTPAIVRRLQTIWEAMRGKVIAAFPGAPGLPSNPQAYLRSLDEIYRSDAYHSLSIEGYDVTPELIEKGQRGDWDRQYNGADRQSRDTLAARGYWQAFGKVKQTIEQAIAGANTRALAHSALRDWYFELIQPFAAAGLVEGRALTGYRKGAVYLRTSRYVPPRSEAVQDGMSALFDLLEQEHEASVRAVLGHWILGYIHPYPDGNGRMARFLMNAMLASGGYPWTVIEAGKRRAYFSALDQASVDLDIQPLARFIATSILKSTKQSDY